MMMIVSMHHYLVVVPCFVGLVLVDVVSDGTAGMEHSRFCGCCCNIKASKDAKNGFVMV